MKVAISSTGKDSSARGDQRFGRAANFIIYDLADKEYQAMDNPATAAAHGAGIQAARLMVDRGVGAVITGNVGPNAMEVLGAAGIKVYAGDERSVTDLVAAWESGALGLIETLVPRHFGSGGSQGRRSG